MGQGHGGLGRRAGSVGPTGSGSGHRPRGAEAPLRLEGAGLGAGWPSPDARGSRRRGSSQPSRAKASAAPQSPLPHRPARPRVSAEPSRGDPGPQGALQSPSSVGLLLAWGPQLPSPGPGLLLPASVLVAPAVHLAAGAAWTRHLRYLILPLRLQPSPGPPAPPSACELRRPDITQARQSWALGDATGASTAPPHLAAAPHLPRGPDVAPPPAPLSLRKVLLSSAAFIPPLHHPRQKIRASPRAANPSPFWPPGSGSRPRPSLAASGNHRHPRKRHRHPRPSLGFQGRQGGSGDS